MPGLQPRIAFAIVALVSVGIVATRFTKAQRSAIDTYAITNARIVTVSGPTIERGTVVIRDGLIAAVGPSVTPPADARVIDGNGLTVYPGLNRLQYIVGNSTGVSISFAVHDAGRRRVWRTSTSGAST